MLTPQELRNIPEDVVSIFEECEDEILKLIGERIRAVGYLNTVSLWQLIKRKESLLFKRNVTRTLSKYTGLSQRQIRRIFEKAGAKALLHDDTFLKAITTKDTRKRTRPLDKILREAYEQTNGTLHNWTGTTANNATNHFVHAMDKAALQVQSGAFSYDEAIRRATRDLADHMDYVTYESGHKDTLEVASRRAVRTGVNQMASKLTLERCKQVGTEFVETTAHVGARETDSEDCTNHSWWQGKVFHLSEEGAVGEDGKFYPGFYGYDQAGYGYGAGICGWNCRHSFHPFIPGVSEPIYTPEELTKLNEKNIEYEGQKYSRYEIDQKQRGLERLIRKYKRREILAESVGDEQEVARNKAFVRKYQDELDKFTKETGNRRDYERERETVGLIAEYKKNQNSVSDYQTMLRDVDNAIDIIAINPDYTREQILPFLKKYYAIGTNKYTGKNILLDEKALGHMIVKHVKDGMLSKEDFRFLKNIVEEMPYSQGNQETNEGYFYYFYKLTDRNKVFDAIVKPLNDHEELFHFNLKGIKGNRAMRNKRKIDRISERLGDDIEF